MTQPSTITCEVRPGTPAVVAIAGDIDPHTAPTLREELEAVDGPVVLDLSGVAFVDSSGLRVLLEANTRRSDSGGIAIRNPSDVVRRVLDLSGLSDVFADG